MKPQTAKQTVEELTEHVTTRLRGLPIATVGIVSNLVAHWIEQEQPEVLDCIGEASVRFIVEEYTR